MSQKSKTSPETAESPVSWCLAKDYGYYSLFSLWGIEVEVLYSVHQVVGSESNQGSKLN